MEAAACVVFFLSIIVVAAVTPLIFIKKKYRITWWDYTFPILGVPFWLILQAFEVGDKVSMTNFIIELFMILVVSISIPWIRFVMSFAKASYVSTISFFLTLSPVVMAICLRLTMPLLPE